VNIETGTASVDIAAIEGKGAREMGSEGLDAYLQTKSVFAALHQSTVM
jgi:hypothetical protein